MSKKHGWSWGMALLLFFSFTACGGGNDAPHQPEEATPITLINLGDSLTNGVQSSSLNETTQVRGFSALLAGQIAQTHRLNWDNPLLAVTQSFRINPSQLPYNLGVSGATAQDLSTQATDSGNRLLNQLLSPIPILAGGPVTQLDAAEFVAGQHLDSLTLLTLWIGNNDLLGAITAGVGTALTATEISAFLADTTAGHDLASLQANLTEMVARLTVIPDSHLFIANLPDVTKIGFLFDADDIERLASFPDPVVISLPPGSAIGLGPFMTVVAPLLATDNLRLNAAIAAVAAIDGNTLSAEEASLINLRMVEINTHIANLAGQNVNVTLVDAEAAFAAAVLGDVVVGAVPFGKTMGAGGLFSLDGVHPSNTAYAFVANIFIEAMRETLGMNIPIIDLVGVQATDPYFDADGDGFVPGPEPFNIPGGVDLLPLADCNDQNPQVIAPLVSGVPCL